MDKLEAQSQNDFSGGWMSDVNVTLAPPNTVNLGINFEYDFEIGSAVTRLGTAQIGSQLVDTKTVLGIVQHVDQADTTKNKLFATINDSTNTNADIFDVGTGISLADDTASLKTRFLNYNGDTLRLNGTDAPKAYNSASWITTGGVFDLANMPTGYKYTKEFLDRVYLWGLTSSPYTLAYSGVLTTGTVSWTSGNGTVAIEPEDNGGEGTGLGKVPGYLLIFKRRSTHRWNFSSAFPESLVQIGAYSQESIVEGGGLCAFYSDSNEDAKGFYITNGDRPVCISQDNNRPIKKWVDAISSTATVAGFATDRYFAWSVGDLTVDGETYNNVVLKYNRLLNQWSIRTYPTQFSVFASYVASGVHSLVGGDDDGNVIQIDKLSTYTDAPGTTHVPYKLRQQHRTYGTNRIKTMSDKVVVRGKNIEDAAIKVICDEDLGNAIPVSGKSVIAKVLSWFGMGKEPKGTTLSVEVSGFTHGAQTHIREIELPSIGVDKNYA